MILLFWVVVAVKGRVGVKRSNSRAHQLTIQSHTLTASWEPLGRSHKELVPLVACTTPFEHVNVVDVWMNTNRVCVCVGGGTLLLIAETLCAQGNSSPLFLLFFPDVPSYYIIYSLTVFSHCKTDINPSNTSITIATTAQNDQAAARSTFQNYQFSLHFSLKKKWILREEKDVERPFLINPAPGQASLTSVQLPSHPH